MLLYGYDNYQVSNAFCIFMHREGIEMVINRELIIALLKDKQWSQNELSRRTGLSKGGVSKMLNGKRGVGRKSLAAFLRIFPELQLDNLIN